MQSKLTLRYDQEGDVLYIDTRPAYAEQESEEIGDDIIARRNPASGDVENLEVLFFSERFREKATLELPVSADLHSVAG